MEDIDSACQREFILASRMDSLKEFHLEFLKKFQMEFQEGI